MNNQIKQMILKFKQFGVKKRLNLKGRIEILTALAEYKVSNQGKTINIKEIIKLFHPDYDEITPVDLEKIVSHYYLQVSCLTLNDNELREEVGENEVTEYIIPNDIFRLVDIFTTDERRHRDSIRIQSLMLLIAVCMIIATVFSIVGSYSRSSSAPENIKLERQIVRQNAKNNALTANVNDLKAKVVRMENLLTPAQ